MKNSFFSSVNFICFNFGFLRPFNFACVNRFYFNDEVQMNFIGKILTLGGLLKFRQKNKPKGGRKARSSAGTRGLKQPKKTKSSDYFENRRGGRRQGGARKIRETSDFGKIVRMPKDVPQIENLQSLRDDVKKFADLGLGDRTLAAIRKMGFSEPTEIQTRAIPIALSGRDIIGTAQTGTGKTAAFTLPIIEKISVSDKIGALILSPTRELAAQIADAVEAFSAYSDVKVVLVQGGVSMQNQINQIKRGTDILVATPGRLLDLMQQKVVDLSAIQYLVLDEVDRMFDMGFIDDVTRIIRSCPKNRQTLFFSATMPPEVLRLSNWALKDPERVEIGIIHSPAETVEHFIYPVDSIQKYDMILSVINSIKDEVVIVFTRTRMDADRIGEWLSAHGFKLAVLHSDKTQRERDKALNSFKDGKVGILVATDIASRGLDISNVGYVINYNVPEHAEDYVHRIGRTGRAKKEGKAITLFSAEETFFLERIERFIGRPIERRKLEGFNYRNEPDLMVAVPKHKKKRNR